MSFYCRHFDHVVVSRCWKRQESDISNVYERNVLYLSLSARWRGDKGTLEAQQMAGVRWVGA